MQVVWGTLSRLLVSSQAGRKRAPCAVIHPPLKVPVMSSIVNSFLNRLFYNSESSIVRSVDEMMECRRCLERWKLCRFRGDGNGIYQHD